MLLAAMITVSRRELLRFVPGILFTVALAACAARCLAAPGIPEIDWRSSPLDLNLRGLNGERFRFSCPPGKVAPGTVTGGDPYADGSSICAAAVHAGAIRAAARRPRHHRDSSGRAQLRRLLQSLHPEREL